MPGVWIQPDCIKGATNDHVGNTVSLLRKAPVTGVQVEDGDDISSE